MKLEWIATAAVVCALSAAPAEAASVAEWRTTIDEMMQDVRATHPDPYAKMGELTFLRDAEALREALPALSEEERTVRAMRLIASIGDGHTQLNPASPAFRSWYPVRIYEFSDGYYVTSAHQSVRELAGARVLEIAGRPVAEVAEAARDLRGADNMFDRRQRLEALHNAGAMRGLGFAADDGSVRITARLANGRTVQRTLSSAPMRHPFFNDANAQSAWFSFSEVFGPPVGPFEEWISAYRGLSANAFREVDLTRAPHLMYRRLQVARAMPEHDAYYLQINAVAPEQMLPFLQEHLAAIDAQRPRRVILDIRYNGGGDGSRMTEIVHQFVQRADNPPWREFYLVTGRRTFSAAVMMVEAFVNNVSLTIVGEPAGAGFNSYGDADEHRYAAPELSLYISTLRHQLSASNDLRPLIPVDVPAPMSFADYVAGRDPAVDPILAGAEMRSITEIARTDGGAAARRAYLERRERFGRLGWWTPPAEIELRQACDALRDQDRPDDALELCQLTAEIHPFIWNSWYNLGQVQRAAGQTSAYAASLKCVRALDPTNPNDGEISTALAEAGDVPLPAGCPVEGGV